MVSEVGAKKKKERKRKKDEEILINPGLIEERKRKRNKPVETDTSCFNNKKNRYFGRKYIFPFNQLQ